MRFVATLVLGTFGTVLATEPSMFRADARHGGIYHAAAVPVLHGVKWKFAAGGPIVSTPAVSAGTVYFGSNDHTVYALDDLTGALRWKDHTHGRVSASPGVAGGPVAVGRYDRHFYSLYAAGVAPLLAFRTGGGSALHRRP